MSRFARNVALAPSVIVAVTALFALPQQAGGYRLAKWGVFALALAVLGVALLVRRGPYRLPRRWLAPVVFAVSAIALPVFSSERAITHWPSALGLLSGLAFFALTAMALDDDAASRRASLVVLTGSGVVCALVVLLQAAGLTWLTSDVYTGLEFRAPGTLGNPNWAAAFLAMLVPLALGLAATAERRWPHHAVAAVLAIATLATLSKGGALTLAAAVLFFVTPKRWHVPLFAIAVVCGVVGAVLFAHASWLQGRLFLWRAGLVMLREHPLTGVGLGGYVPAYGRAAAELVNGDVNAFLPLSSIDFAHNAIVQLAAEGGVLVAIAFIGLVVLAMRRDDPLSRAMSAVLVGFVVNGLADSPLHVPATFVLFFFALGWLTPTVPSTLGGRVIVVAAVVLGTVQGARFIAGNASWTKGRDALRANQPAVAPLERTRLLLPEHGRSASQYARALARAGRIDDALAASAKAAALRFDFDDEFFRRDLQTRTLDRAASIASWEELSARFPVLVTPYLRLGALYLQANDRSSAIAAYERAVATSQDSERAQAGRRQAHEMLQSLLR